METYLKYLIDNNNKKEIKIHFDKNNPNMKSLDYCNHRSYNEVTQLGFHIIDEKCECNKEAIAFYKMYYYLLCYAIKQNKTKIAKMIFNELNPSCDNELILYEYIDEHPNELFDHMLLTIESKIMNDELHLQHPNCT